MIEQDAFNGLVILTKFLEVAGAGAIVLGFIIASVRCLGEAFGKEILDWYNDYRKALGRVVLIGLEVLVAATILKTITTDSSLESLGMLAMMIIIRTILSWSMVLEITGRWPWRSAPAKDP